MSRNEDARPFSQVDVFASGGLRGNPVAVVHDADGLTDDGMQRFANWTNLSETTFVCAPREAGADYRLRIFTPAGELPFAGHPTLGSAHAWLAAGGVPRDGDFLVQECGVGLVRVRRAPAGLAFAAPELVRYGPVGEDERAQAVRALGIANERVLGVQWIDNGPGWLGVRLASAEDVLALRPDYFAMGSLAVTVVGAFGDGGPADFEVRAFAPGEGLTEDPVTGSANAGIAQWLTRTGVVDSGYTARQGTVLGRGGRVTVELDGDTIWIGGATETVIEGSVTV
ncbi:PhzF family phenazine biosynthesis protein [Rhodococcus sp. HNM0569]|uniref:PhzF family phenazine biosynthesis isomerase n=1 Tax=Rhodococcus sp. HNM0569 TaxID=2716340 RepID=UPI00146BB093|nr:PhzF family phenazine biosynthesis protein [Rhodococcus sp. HNM0569]